MRPFAQVIAFFVAVMMFFTIIGMFVVIHFIDMTFFHTSGSMVVTTITEAIHR
jgi:hypothetical protein